MLSCVSLGLGLVAIGCRIGIAFCDGDRTVRSGWLNILYGPRTRWEAYWVIVGPRLQGRVIVRKGG